MLSGNSSALPIDATLGTKPCWRAWLQNVGKSGGITTPVSSSQPASLKALIWAVKSALPFS